jgi:hypothetical protein
VHRPGRYDRDRRPWIAPAPELRLLPWESPEGKPCYLRAGGDGGVVSRLADNMEEAQLSLGTEALADARTVLDDATAGPLTLRVALRRTTWSLSDVLRIADSRGARIPPADGGEEEAAK